MDPVDIGTELRKMSSMGEETAALPHPESPVKTVADLPSHHCEESDFQSHHRDHISYHEPMQRPHHHHHHHHHRHHHSHRKHHQHRESLQVQSRTREMSISTQATGILGTLSMENVTEETPADAESMRSTSFTVDSGRKEDGAAAMISPRKMPPPSPSKVVLSRPQLPTGSGSGPQIPTAADGTASPRPTDLGFGPKPNETRKERHHRRRHEEKDRKLASGSHDGHEGSDSPGHRKHHHHHHHRRHHHHHHRRSVAATHGMPTELEEALALPGRDLDDMAAHRWDAPRKQSLIDRRINDATTAAGPVVPVAQHVKEIDHRPHDMFVELEELQYGEGDKLQWRETARWIKYEEDVVEEADRWGKPHVASLSFHSLLQLRTCIEHGTVLLDLECDDLPSIAGAVVDNMIATDQLPAQLREPILQALLLRHVHQSDPHSTREEAPASQTAHATQSLPMVYDAESGLGTPTAKLKQYGKLRESADSVIATATSTDMPGVRRSSTHMSRQLSQQFSQSYSLVSANSSASAQQSGFLKEEPEAYHDPHLHEDSGNEPQHDPVTASFMPPDPAAAAGGSGVQRLDSVKESNAPGTFTPPRRNSFSMAVGGSEDLGVRDLNTLLEQTLEAKMAVEEEDNQPLPKEERELLEHLAPDVEATTVLVGALDFLTRPTIALVRLSEGRRLGHITEIPIPVRFLFVLLGPPNYDFGGLGSTSYHEIGRGIATLMADKEVLEDIYAAEHRSDILHTFDLFLDDSMVLPPGRWEDKDKLDLHHHALQQRSRSRRLRKQDLPATPPSGGGDDDDDPLARTGVFCGGMIKDLRRLRRRYISDFKDALSRQVFFTALFMYFAALAPVITFGGLLEKTTESNIGLSEMLVGTSIGGMVFSLLAGQPLMLIGPTGPLLVFEKLIYNFCKANDWPFMQFRFWTGMWVFVILFVVVATDASLLAKKFTRFTEEVFAFLIGFIFIYEALKSVYDSFQANPLNFEYCTSEHCSVVNSNASFVNGTGPTSLYTSSDSWSNSSQDALQCSRSAAFEMQLKAGGAPKNLPNTALANMLIVFLTFALSFFFRFLRHSKYLSKGIRRTASDFGVVITIITADIIAHFGLGVELEFVKQPSFGTTLSRSILVDPLANNMSVALVFGTMIPAFLVAFLVFVETQVTCLIVTSPDHKLVKGQGFHWNLFIVSVLIAISSALGLPWLCGTPVPSLSHTTSLLVYEKTRAPGERPKIAGAVEQRVSNFAIHALLLITLVPAVTSLLSEVPVSVLFGVFLYLGVVSLLGLQFAHRLVLLIVPPKHHPDDVAYVRLVRLRQMRIYTVIQLLCLGVLIAVKQTAASPAFPLIILLMVPLRNKVVTRFFSERELEALDPHETSSVDYDAESFDEYEATHLAV
ncbi:anion exchange protein 2-like [Sycon ciliatum]|uniref:anion exchange protein 2-like n=1 Tax=Sycon ciliatum TaxID=27933 RepID=UPI0020AE2648|eukprot:scpid18817/ scgid8852/ Anion exchange protein 2; Non-erythroid band 3-like protein; Solute carrier family 4 member 2